MLLFHLQDPERPETWAAQCKLSCSDQQAGPLAQVNSGLGMSDVPSVLLAASRRD